MEDIVKKYLDGEGYYLDPQEIEISESRARKDFNRAAMEELKTSILALGQLQPVIITRAKELVAGERRLIACKDLGREVWCAYIDEIDLLALKRAEYDENVKRHNLSPPEEMLLKDSIHAMLVERGGDEWSARDSARNLGEGHSQFNEDLKFAQYIKAIPNFFEDCQTKSDVRRVVKSLDRKVEERLLQQKVDALSEEEKLAQTMTVTGVKHDQYIDREDVDGIVESLEQREIVEIPVESPGVIGKEEYIKAKLKGFNATLLTGDCFDHLPKVKNGSIGVMLLDPPWGQELQDKVEAGLLRGDEYEDSKEEFERTFPILIRLAYEKMSANSHLYCFFAITSHHFVYKTLGEAGFNINHRPIVLQKIGIKSTRLGDYWPAASYEAVAFAKKGQRQLVTSGAPDSYSLPWATPTEKRGHISAKPPEAYLRLLRISALPGDIICDPMYGSGAAFVACEMMPELKLSWFGWELNEDFRRIALMRLTSWIVKAKEEEELITHTEDPSLVDDSLTSTPLLYNAIQSWKQLEPGTPEWSAFFKANPDKQKEMLEWKNQNSDS